MTDDHVRHGVPLHRVPILGRFEIGKRKCDGCTACCFTFQNAALDKPLHRWCQHVREGGCGVYEKRPLECSDFYCSWLVSPDVLRDSDRPDRIGVVFDPLPNPSRLRHEWVDPPRQKWMRVTQIIDGAWLRPRPREIIDDLLARGVCVCVVHVQPRATSPDFTILVPGREPTTLHAMEMVPGRACYWPKEIVEEGRVTWAAMTDLERGAAIAECAIMDVLPEADADAVKLAVEHGGEPRQVLADVLEGRPEILPLVNAKLLEWFKKFPQLQQTAICIDFVGNKT